MQDKSHLRIKFKELRKFLNLQQISTDICNNIRSFELYNQSHNVMLFYPTDYEINLLELLKDKKNFFFPKINGKDLEVCPYFSNVEFKKSKFNILEPCSTPVNSELLDLVFVPALAVDEHKYRLGYGGGFYDKFLPKCTNAKTIVPIYKDFIIEELPHENHDICVDFIITNAKKAHI